MKCRKTEYNFFMTNSYHIQRSEKVEFWCVDTFPGSGEEGGGGDR